MPTRRVPWWAWVLVAAPWAGGLGWASFAAITGDAGREIEVRGPATVAAIIAGSVVTAVAAALLVTSRAMSGRSGDRPVTLADDPAGTARLLERLDREVVGRLGTVRDALAVVRAAAERGVLAPVDVAALETAASDVDDLSALLADVRTLTDLERAAADPAPVDVRAVLVDVASLVTASPGLGGRRLVGPGRPVGDDPDAAADARPDPATPVHALGDRDLLSLALKKIMLNAITFSRPDSTIGLQVSRRGDAVVVEVSDNGLGIPADELPVVWDAFVRGRSAERTRGVGLGLTLAKAAVERHGGMIRARSREGLGTVVTVLLPVAGRGR